MQHWVHNMMSTCNQIPYRCITVCVSLPVACSSSLTDSNVHPVGMLSLSIWSILKSSSSKPPLRRSLESSCACGFCEGSKHPVGGWCSLRIRKTRTATLQVTIYIYTYNTLSYPFIPFHTLSYPLNSSHSLERKDTLNTLQSESKNNIEQTLMQSTCHNISSHYPSWMVAPLALWRIPWPSRLNLSYGMPHHLMKHSMHVRVNYINKPLWIQEESSTVNVDFGEQLNKSWNEDNQPDWSYHLTPSPLVHGNMQFTCTSMQPSSRCGAVLVGLALLAIVPKFCFGLNILLSEYLHLSSTPPPPHTVSNA